MTETTKFADSSSSSLMSSCSSLTSSCPLCYNDFTYADLIYPLHCPTSTCNFQYCMNCIISFIKSSSDGYSIASDGSNQVKITIRCPMCRSLYRYPNTTTSIQHTLSPSASSNSIVHAILKLRQAASILPPPSSSSLSLSPNHTKSHQHNNDSYLSASQLSQRDLFLRNTTIQELHDSIQIVQDYYDTIPEKKNNTNQKCNISSTTVPLLQFDILQSYIDNINQNNKSNHKNSTTTTSVTANSIDDNNTDTIETTIISETSSSSSSSVIVRDPTLFMGLDDLLTYDEQEFITQMFVSGQTELIAQAAHLLHSILLLQQQKQKGNNSNTTTNNTTNTNNNNSSILNTKNMTNKKAKNMKSIAQIDYEYKIKLRYPLPKHMPLVVMIPPYNPLVLQSSKNNIIPIKFVPKNNNNNTTTNTNSGLFSRITSKQSQQSQSTIPSQYHELMINSVHGIAGRVGLRRYDIITHINHQRITTFSEYTIMMQYILSQQQEQGGGDNTNQNNNMVTITVNATEEIAQQLLQRAQLMKQQNVQFHI